MFPLFSGGGWFVSTCYKLVVCAAGYAYDFCGDPRLVEACRREFAGDVLFL